LFGTQGSGGPGSDFPHSRPSGFSAGLPPCRSRSCCGMSSVSSLLLSPTPKVSAYLNVPDILSACLLLLQPPLCPLPSFPPSAPATPPLVSSPSARRTLASPPSSPYWTSFNSNVGTTWPPIKKRWDSARLPWNGTRNCWGGLRAHTAAPRSK
jgi:hypothetical protein